MPRQGIPFIRQLRSGRKGKRVHGRGMPDGVPGEHGLYQFQHDFADYEVDGVTPKGAELEEEFLAFFDRARARMSEDAEKYGIRTPTVDFSDFDYFISSSWYIFEVFATNEVIEGTNLPDWSAGRKGWIKDRSFQPGTARTIQRALSDMRQNADLEDVESKLDSAAADSEYIFVKFINVRMYFATAPIVSAKGEQLISSFGRQYFQRGLDDLRRQREAEQAALREQREKIDAEYQAQLLARLKADADAFDKARKAEAFRRKMAAGKAKAAEAREAAKAAKAAALAEAARVARQAEITRKRLATRARNKALAEEAARVARQAEITRKRLATRARNKALAEEAARVARQAEITRKRLATLERNRAIARQAEITRKRLATLARNKASALARKKPRKR